MGAVFEREGFDVAAAAVAADDVRRGCLALRHRPPDTRFGLELHDLGEPLAQSEFKVFAGALALRRRRARDQRRRARAAALGARRAHRARQAARREGSRVGVRPGRRQRWRSPIAKFLSESGDRRRSTTRLEAHPGDLLLIVADEVTTAGQALERAAAGARPALRPDPGGPPRHPLGGRVPDVLLGRRTSSAGTPPTIRSPRRPATSTIRRASPRAPTTSCSTAPRSAAARSASTDREVQQRVFELLGISAGGGPGAVRLPARRAPLRRAAARRDRDGHRPDRRRARRARLDPRRDRVPEGRERRRSADRRAGAGRPAAAARARPAPRLTPAAAPEPRPSAGRDADAAQRVRRSDSAQDLPTGADHGGDATRLASVDRLARRHRRVLRAVDRRAQAELVRQRLAGAKPRCQSAIDKAHAAVAHVQRGERRPRRHRRDDLDHAAPHRPRRAPTPRPRRRRHRAPAHGGEHATEATRRRKPSAATARRAPQPRRARAAAAAAPMRPWSLTRCTRTRSSRCCSTTRAAPMTAPSSRSWRRSRRTAASVVKLAVPLSELDALPGDHRAGAGHRLADARADRSRAARDDDRRVHRPVRDRAADRRRAVASSAEVAPASILARVDSTRV